MSVSIGSVSSGAELQVLAAFDMTVFGRSLSHLVTTYLPSSRVGMRRIPLGGLLRGVRHRPLAFAELLRRGLVLLRRHFGWPVSRQGDSNEGNPVWREVVLWENN